MCVAFASPLFLLFVVVVSVTVSMSMSMVPARCPGDSRCPRRRLSTSISVSIPIKYIRCYQEALERQPGDHMINPRVHHSVAETLEAMGGYTDALKHERLSHAG